MNLRQIAEELPGVALADGGERSRFIVCSRSKMLFSAWVIIATRFSMAG